MPTWKDLKSIINAWKTELGSYVKTSTLKAKLDGYATKKELGNYLLMKDGAEAINDIDASVNDLWMTLNNYVKTVNNVAPDGHGNVDIETVSSYNDLTDTPCSEIIGKTLLHDFGELLATQTGNAFYATFEDDIQIIKGNEYCVNFKGVDYYVIAKWDDMLGSSAWQPGMGSDKDFPFYIRSDLKRIYCDGAAVLNVTIHTVERTITPLDEKFLPHKYVQTVNSIEPDENGNISIEIPETLVITVRCGWTGYEEYHESDQDFANILNVLNNGGICYVKLISHENGFKGFTCYYITEVSETSIKAYAFGSDKYLEFTSDGSINHTAS